jgi:hypothetical protein
LHTVETYYMILIIRYMRIWLRYVRKYNNEFCLLLAWQPPSWARTSSFVRFLDHTQRGTTVGRTPLDDWPALRSDLYLTTHNTHKRETSMLPEEFEPSVLTDERPQTNALERTATGTGNEFFRYYIMLFKRNQRWSWDTGLKQGPYLKLREVPSLPETKHILGKLHWL